MPQLDGSELIRIFAEVLEVNPATLSEKSAPDNVEGWDSGKAMEIVITLEEALNLEFTAGELDEMVSIGATQEILKRRGVFVQR
jgi:acyl carrier protein